MADITIDASVLTDIDDMDGNVLMYDKDEDNHYIFFLDSDSSAVFYKSTDGGATWNAAVKFSTGADVIEAISIFPREWVTGVASDVLHVVVNNITNTDIDYIQMDTSDDSFGSWITAVAAGAQNSGIQQASIIETHGGNLLIAAQIRSSTTSLARSVAAEAPTYSNWTARTTPFSGNTHAVKLSPGVEAADDNDAWAIELDLTNDKFQLRVYDDSGNSYTDADILTNDGTAPPSRATGWSLVHRQSDGHTIFAAWDALDHANADLRVFDIASGASITEKNSSVASGAEHWQATLTINQQTDKLFLGYLKGTAVSSLVNPFYVGSVNGGTDWASPAETAVSESAEDDHRLIGSPSQISDAGGSVMFWWFNDDLNDLLTNYVNRVDIPAAAAGGRIMSSLVGAGGLAAAGGIAGRGGGLVA